MKNRSRRLLALSSSVDYAFYRTRLLCLLSENIQIDFAGFLSCPGYECRPLPIPVKVLGNISVGKYISRILVFLKSVGSLRKKIILSDGLYVFGLDMMLLVMCILLTTKRNPYIILEIHDIRDILLKNNVLSRILRFLDKKAVRRSSLIVVTSEAYIRQYYNKVLNLRSIPYMVLENKLIAEKSILDKPELPPLGDGIRIGYFGALRSPSSVKILKRVAESPTSSVSVLIRGVPVCLSQQTLETFKSQNIKYKGPYRDPEDLYDIYKSVHLVWAAGKQSKSSYKWSKTCRFYNAIRFARPLVVEKGTEDAKDVLELGIGFAVDSRNPDAAVKTLLSITEKKLKTYYSNLLDISDDAYFYKNEHKALKAKIMEIAKNESN